MVSKSISPLPGRSLPSGGAYEGTPPHFRDALVNWLEDLLTVEDEFDGKVSSQEQ